MNIRYPINIVSDDIDNVLSNITGLLDATNAVQVNEGTKFEDVSFIGPYNLVKDLLCQAERF